VCCWLLLENVFVANEFARMVVVLFINYWLVVVVVTHN
jgi:hypothetical protein